MMKKINFFLFFVVSALFSLPLSAALFKAHEFVLENGLQVVVIENHKAPIIKHMLWYKSGAVDEEYGRGGSAHLLEHLMFRGTDTFPHDEFNNIMEKNGVISNAFTGHDVTVYHQTADISKLEVLMALEADRMHNLNFDQAAFAAEQKIVWQERKQVVENNPAAPFAERLNLLLWGFSPYARPITGLPDEILSLQDKDIYNFYHSYYAPNNAILVLSGDIDLKTARTLVNKYYGSKQRAQVAKKAFAVQQEQFTETLKMSLPNIAATKVVYKYLLPSHKQLGRRIYDYLVLAEYLGGDDTAELYQQLVVQMGKALSASAAIDFTAHGNSIFAVTVLPVETDENELQTLITNVAEKAIQQDLDAKKLEQIKHKMQADLIYLQDNPEDGAYWMGYMMALGFSFAEVQQYAENIQNVSLAGVRSAFAELQNVAKVTGVLTPIALPNEQESGDDK